MRIAAYAMSREDLLQALIHFIEFSSFIVSLHCDYLRIRGEPCVFGLSSNFLWLGTGTDRVTEARGPLTDASRLDSLHARPARRSHDREPLHAVRHLRETC
jgi:hypothetical protein